MTEERFGDWLQAYSGQPIWPLDLRPDEIHISDIAHALGYICRYNGHCTRFYSVAEHSVALSYAVPPEHALWGLLHDASEYVLCDIPRPVKPYIPGYKEIEAKVQKTIIEEFGLTWPEPTIVKIMDTRILANEKATFMKESWIPWGGMLDPIPNLTLVGWSPDEAGEKFLHRYHEITNPKNTGSFHPVPKRNF